MVDEAAPTDVEEKKDESNIWQYEDKIEEETKPNELIPSGIPGLDDAVGGGLPKGSTILIAGAPGTCKTTFGAQFIYEGAMKGEGGVILSFDEGPSRFKANMLPFGWDFSKLENEKKVMINHVKPLQVEQFAKQEGIIIGEMISSMNAKRVFLDSITPFEMMFEREYDRRLYVSRLLEEVHKYGCTLIISSETSGKELSKFGEIEYIVDGIIKLELDPHEVSYSRTLTILKMRGLEHYVGGIPFKVTKEGVRVLYEKG